MTPTLCSKAWQVEAIRDGRLTGSALRLAERHIRGCPVCSQEQLALSELSTQLRELDGEVDELALRRLRQLTLARALAVSPRPVDVAISRWKTAKWLVLGAAALAVSLGGMRFVRSRLPAGVEVLATPSAGAIWTSSRSGDVEYIDLAEGLLSVTVHHSGARGRLVVRLPDGRIEDVGTRFRVWVSHGSTAEISVAEGAVVFRRARETDLRLRAGDSWRPAIAAAEVVASPGTDGSARIAVVPPAIAPARPVQRRKGAPREIASADAPAHEQSRAPEATESPSDLEDAAYMHIIALVREHRSEEARLAAGAFLRDFPRAFRRLEVERVARPASETESH
jgi:hypothetical protein